jgi:hypothetical protein
MPKKSSQSITPAKGKSVATNYDTILAGLVELLDSARHTAARAVNSVITTAYFQIGQRIVELEQGGSRKADYGEQLVDRLAYDLTQRYGRGFGRRNLFQMRSFYLTYNGIVQSVSAQFDSTSLSRQFPLSWSHYVRLLGVRDPEARAFYEAEALRGGWSIRQLDRLISSMFYQRALLSRNKAAMITRGVKPSIPVSARRFNLTRSRDVYPEPVSADIVRPGPIVLTC